MTKLRTPEKNSTTNSKASKASTIAGLLGRSRPRITPERQLKEDELLAKAKEREAHQEKVDQVASIVEGIVQSQLPDDSPQDKETGLKYGSHEVEGLGPDDETVTFSHFPRHHKSHSGALTTIVRKNDDNTRTLELTDDHGLTDMTLITVFDDGRFERLRTLSDKEFDLTDRMRQVRGVSDLAEICLQHAQNAQSLANTTPV